MPFAGNQHDVTGSCLRDSGRDGGRPIEHHGIPPIARLADTTHDLTSDFRRIFAAWVVTGDEQAIGKPGSDPTHFRALPAVSITATSEEADQPAAACHGGPERRENFIESVRRMRVIDYDEWIFDAAQPLHPSRRWCHRTEET